MALQDIQEALGAQYEALSEKIPHFPYFFAAVLVAILAIAAFLVFAGPENVEVKLLVKNAAGAGVKGAQVRVSGLAEAIGITTDKDGKASFNAPLGKSIEISVSKQDYTTAKKSVTVSKGASIDIVLRQGGADVPAKEITLTFVGPDSRKLDGVGVAVHISCSGSGIPQQGDYTVSAGELKVVPPENCGRLIVTATAAGFETANAEVLRTEQVISFVGIEKPKGGAIITIIADDTNKFADGINVRLLDSSGLPTGFEGTSSFGEVNFSEIEIGSYTALITDLAGDYAGGSTQIFVQENSTARQSVRITKDVKIKARVKAVEIGGGAIAGATATIYNSNGTIAGQAIAGPDGTALVLVKEHGTYTYTASKEGYVPADKNSFTTYNYAKGSQQDFIVRMRKCTPQTCGIVKVRVLDENALPVENARVSLLDSEGFVLTQFGSLATDFNGYAGPFLSVAEGTYTALGQKFPAEARSDAFDVDVSKQNNAVVHLKIGSGTVTAVATDIDGRPIEFAKADIFTDSGLKIGTVALDATGKSAPLSVKADKKVYAVLGKEGYASYTTSARQVYPEKALQFTAVLEQSIPGEKPMLELLGVFSETGARATALKSGGRYYARFLLSVPGNGLSEAGVFVRAGDRENLAAENIWVEAANGPRSIAIKGATYSPATANGDEELTNGAAKWVSLNWANPQEGKYEVEATLKVRNGIIKGTSLPIFYRAWGVGGSGYLRDPVDSVLGTNEDAPGKNGLYAESYEKAFLEGIDESCAEDFCFSTRLLDETQGIYIPQQPYGVKTFAPYTLEFVLTNNSQARHDDAAMTIRNTRDLLNTAKEISINSYSIENASASLFTGSAPAFDINAFAMGAFRQNKVVSGTLRIETKTLNASAIEFKVVSGQNVAFDRAVAFAPVADTDINLSVKPDAIGAFVPIDLNVQAYYNSGDNKGFGIEQGRVVVRRISPDRSETRFIATTNGNGFAKVQVPASSPGTRLIITVQKAGLGIKSVERQVTSSVVGFDPEKLEPRLNRATNKEAKVPISIDNLVSTGLSIKKIRVSVPHNDLLDTERMNSYLSKYLGGRVPSESVTQIDMLAVLGKQADLLDAPTKAKGSLLIELAVLDNPAVSYVLELPMEAMINLAELPQNAPCISLSKKEWKDATLGSRASLELEIQNNCVTANGAKLSFDNLQSRVQWTGSDGIVGQVELSVTDPISGAVSSEILQQGVWTKLLSNLEPSIAYPARITFVPKQDTLGKTAEFTVKIDSQLTTNTGGEFVGSNNDIEAEIVVANLDQCIEIEPQPEKGIHIGRADAESQFTISTEKCGPVPLDIRFCGGPGGDYCRGGTKEGGLTLQPWGFNAVNKESREVKVTRQEIPGFYGITVEARPSGGSWRQVAEIDTIVEPEEGEYFTMDRYNFTVIGKGAKDSAALTNQMLQESVNVRANLCDWDEASKGMKVSTTSIIIGMAGGALAGFAAYGLVTFALGPAAIIGIVVAILITVILSLFGEDPCEKYDTHALTDYVINLAGTSDPSAARYLPPDALNIIMGDSRIRGGWNEEITDAVQKKNRKYPNGKQIVGVVFENVNAVQDRPVFSIAAMRAKEHVHGDPLHQRPATTCRGSDFGTFWLNPGTCGQAGNVYDTVYSQKFHLKFKVAEEKVSLPQVGFDTYACQSGVDIGRTGNGALPKIKLNWSWQEPNNGITYNQCDAGNPDYIYCDAAQFTIELNKKLHTLYEFLAENNWDLGCPELREESQEAEEQIGLLKADNAVAEGMAGVSGTSASIAGSSISIVATAHNRTNSEQGIVVENTLYSTAGNTETCQMDIQGIPANGQKQGECTVPLPAGEGLYIVTSAAQGGIFPELLDTRFARNGIYVGDPLEDAKKAACEVKSTETMFGEPQLLRFIDNKDNIKWTDRVPNRAALEKLLIFDSYLMKDNFSKEFFGDFASYYTNESFEDADSYFNRLSQDGAGKNYGFNRLMEQNKFKFTRKYVQSSELPAAGLYRIEWAIYFGKDDWRFFDGGGDPKISASVVVNRIGDPYPASPFYSMPFDGLVGLNGNMFSRKNYGVAFTPKDPNDLVWITGGDVPVKSYPDNGSNPVTRVGTRISSDIYSLNVSPATRGMILQVSNPSGKSADIVFQPSHATPVLMKATQTAITGEPFSAYYSLNENGNNVTIGNSLSYWDGAGACSDFSGVPVTEAFYQKPDRLIGERDRLFEIKNAYAIDWKQASKKGDVYLRAIFYTDPGKDYALKSQPMGIENSFKTPDGSGPVVGLGGVGSMENNSYSAGAGGTIASIEEALRMVSNGTACLTNTGEAVKIWWNPQAVYTATGTKDNISGIANSLKAGETCIG